MKVRVLIGVVGCLLVACLLAANVDAATCNKKRAASVPASSPDCDAQLVAVSCGWNNENGVWTTQSIACKKCTAWVPTHEGPCPQQKNNPEYCCSNIQDQVDCKAPQCLVTGDPANPNLQCTMGPNCSSNAKYTYNKSINNKCDVATNKCPIKKGDIVIDEPPGDGQEPPQDPEGSEGGATTSE